MMPWNYINLFTNYSEQELYFNLEESELVDYDEANYDLDTSSLNLEFESLPLTCSLGLWIEDLTALVKECFYNIKKFLFGEEKPQTIVTSFADSADLLMAEAENFIQNRTSKNSISL